MDSNRSRFGMLIGLGAAAGAFGVAAMMSAATAPTARADAYSDIISAVDGDFAAGEAEFASALLISAAVIRPMVWQRSSAVWTTTFSVLEIAST
jgi:hypothetical protein